MASKPTDSDYLSGVCVRECVLISSWNSSFLSLALEVCVCVLQNEVVA